MVNLFLKNNSKKIIRSIFFIVILCICTWTANYVLSDKSSMNKNKDFFDEKNDIDVFFCGSSHAELFFNPLELWKNYGFTSYNFGAPEEPIKTTYWVIKSAIEIHKPKIVVLEMHMFNLNKVETEKKLPYSLDTFPINKTKYEAILDLSNGVEDFFDKLFPLSSYHQNWKKMDKSNFVNIDKFIKGSMSYGYVHTMKINPFSNILHTDELSNILTESDDYIYLNKIVELCNDNNIKLLLVSTPYYCNESNQRNINAAVKYAKNNNLPIINMVEMDSIIDLKIDLYDEGHVNQSGMQKVTDYIGSYISTYYDLPDHRNDYAYNQWNIDYEDYKGLKYESIWWQDDLETVLMMLHDSNIKSYIYLGENIHDDEQLATLMQNIVRKNVLVDTLEKKSENDYPLDKINTSYSSYLLKVDSEISEYIDEEAEYIIKGIINEYEDLYEHCAYVVVIDKDSNNIKLIQRYSLDENDENNETIFCDVEPKYMFVD